MIDFLKKAVILKLKSVFIAFLGCLSGVSYGQKTDIKTEISQLQEQQKLAGAVWAIVENDSIKTYASGYKNLKTKEQMHESDWVNVGSFVAFGCCNFVDKINSRCKELELLGESCCRPICHTLSCL